MRFDLWPVRRWLVDRLIGKQSYSRNVSMAPQDWQEPRWSTQPPFKPFDQDAS